MKDDAPPRPRSESWQLSVNRNHAPHREHLCGEVAFALFTFQELFDLRVLHDETMPLARGQRRRPVHPERLLRRQPPREVRLVEEDETQGAGTVVQDRLEDREAPTSGPDEARGEDGSLDGRRRALGDERADGADARAVLVPEREVEEEVDRRLDAGLGQLLRAGGADAGQGRERRKRGASFRPC